MNVTGTPVGVDTATNSELDSELRLPRPPGVLRRWIAAHPRAVDWIIVATYLLACALAIIFALSVSRFAGEFAAIDPEAQAEVAGVASFLEWPWAMVVILIIVVTAVALLYRRQFPLTGLVVVALLLFFEQGTLTVPNSMALVVLLYAVPLYRGLAQGWVGYAIVVAVNTAQIFLSGNTSTAVIGPSVTIFAADGQYLQDSNFILSTINALWLLAVLMISINLSNRRRYVGALIERAHQLEREREQQTALAAAAERSRIAREMHDIVAHSLSVVVTLSEAASVTVESQPEAAKNAMERAAETGRTALVEMRRLLGVLGEGDGKTTGSKPAADRSLGEVAKTAEASSAPRSPQPGMAELYGLIDGFRQAGLEVTVAETGVSAGDASQQLAVFRIIQEGLTNTLRYAGRGARTDLTLRHSPEETSVEVLDHGPAHRAGEADQGGDAAASTLARPIPGSGRGLTGAAQRAKIFGGSFEAGPHGTGWRLVATVPAAAPAEDHHGIPEERSEQQ